jgi:hypothetical protein
MVSPETQSYASTPPKEREKEPDYGKGVGSLLKKTPDPFIADRPP